MYICIYQICVYICRQVLKFVLSDLAPFRASGVGLLSVAIINARQAGPMCEKVSNPEDNRGEENRGGGFVSHGRKERGGEREGGRDGKGNGKVCKEKRRVTRHLLLMLLSVSAGGREGREGGEGNKNEKRRVSKQCCRFSTTTHTHTPLPPPPG